MVKSVLFACNMNSVRSPMAAALLRAQAGAAIMVDSAGVWEGGPDPFVEIVLGEIGVAVDSTTPKTMRGLDLEKFDLAIVLTPEAASEARRYLPRERIEYWPIDNPSDVYGGREQILEAYRAVREELSRRLKTRFSKPLEDT